MYQCVSCIYRLSVYTEFVPVFQFCNGKVQEIYVIVVFVFSSEGYISVDFVDAGQQLFTLSYHSFVQECDIIIIIQYLCNILCECLFAKILNFYKCDTKISASS